MKYGAGSALLNDVIARSNSCCKVFNRTGSALLLLLLVCALTQQAGMARNKSQIKKGLKDCMVWRVYLIFHQRRGYLRRLTFTAKGAKDATGNQALNRLLLA